jgi:hypothetical protein
MANPIAPALDHVLLTREHVDKWRRENKYPRGRIGIFFGVRTAIHFCDRLDPVDFDFWPLAAFPNGTVQLERGILARCAFIELHPEAEVIFGRSPLKSLPRN